jgi:CRP/FNR family transcriptional regulator
MKEISEMLSFLGPDLISEIENQCEIVDIPRDTVILREGQYVKVIPIVIDGLIKVFSTFDEKELLLYYIQAKESCIMSFASSLKNEPSKVYAITEEDSRVLLLPIDKVANWIKQYPSINTLFYQQFNIRYAELMDTINHVLFNKMDKRLFDYLKERTRLTKQNPIKISHRQIASELGTAREVISRVMKKLENEGLVKQHTSSIEVL